MVSCKLYLLGCFESNYLSGFGCSHCNNANSSSYLGYWVNSKHHGIGMEIWENGSIYKGNYLEGFKAGIGVYYWKNGARYSGEWNNNKMEGYVRKLSIFRVS